MTVEFFLMNYVSIRIDVNQSITIDSTKIKISDFLSNIKHRKDLQRMLNELAIEQKKKK